ncbi:GNAT family N-acetyltransferase [Acidimangrovimonas sediminis]|uniref:GNAT family N-acetyltransferase n=1 Tax=Acidimangrovimonas sediminis TaxID=2056283 RepID=UPI000C807966|nr:GNAT family N-acetyltransferase [Acidimangrovimonas sediminis]
MQGIDIRKAASVDVPAMQEIVIGAYTPYVARIGRPPAPMTEDYAALVAAGQAWVVTVDGAVAGLIVLVPGPDHLLVDNVAVGRAHQGHGLGRLLLEFAEGFARAQGLEELRLYTNEMMHENLKIYPRLGWEEYARAEQDGFRRVFMRKRVSGATA